MRLFGSTSASTDAPFLPLLGLRIEAEPHELKLCAQFFKDLVNSLKAPGPPVTYRSLNEYFQESVPPSFWPASFDVTIDMEGSAGAAPPPVIGPSAAGCMELCSQPISPGEFLGQWTRWNGHTDLFARYPSQALTPFGVGPEDQSFLSCPGLPVWAAPHVHFFFPGGAELPAPVGAHGAAIPGAESLGMLGSCHDSWPICLDPSRPGQLFCLTRETDLMFLNSSCRQLAACLLAYCQMVETALAFGKPRGDPDCFRGKNYPAELDTRLRDSIRQIDEPAVSEGSFWAWHFDHDRARA